MKSLNFNTNFKTFCINGDETRVISVDTTDIGILNRAEQAKGKLEKLLSESTEAIKNKTEAEQFELLSVYDTKMRKIINDIFNSDVSTQAFGNSNCLSFCGGQPLCVNFLNALISEIESDMKNEGIKARNNISKYTDQLQQLK